MAVTIKSSGGAWTSDGVDPKLQNLLTKCGLSHWIGMLSMDARAQKYDEIVEAGPAALRNLFSELNADLDKPIELPKPQLERLVELVFGAARASGKEVELPDDTTPMRERWTFEQTATEARLVLRRLPMDLKARDVKMQCAPSALSLSVRGEEVLKQAKLHAPIEADESEFQLDDTPCKQSRVLTVSLPKAGAAPSYATGREEAGPPWPSLVSSG